MPPIDYRPVVPTILTVVATITLTMARPVRPVNGDMPMGQRSGCYWLRVFRNARKGIVTLTSAGRLEVISGNIEPIRQRAERRSPAARC
jgi:hypothetical protein